MLLAKPRWHFFAARCRDFGVSDPMLSPQQRTMPEERQIFHPTSSFVGEPTNDVNSTQLGHSAPEGAVPKAAMRGHRLCAQSRPPRHRGPRPFAPCASTVEKYLRDDVDLRKPRSSFQGQADVAGSNKETDGCV